METILLILAGVIIGVVLVVAWFLYDWRDFRPFD